MAPTRFTASRTALNAKYREEIMKISNRVSRDHHARSARLAAARIGVRWLPSARREMAHRRRQRCHHLAPIRAALARSLLHIAHRCASITQLK